MTTRTYTEESDETPTKLNNHYIPTVDDEIPSPSLEAISQANASALVDYDDNDEVEGEDEGELDFYQQLESIGTCLFSLLLLTVYLYPPI